MIRPSFGLGGVCTRPVRDRATGDPPASSNCTRVPPDGSDVAGGFAGLAQHRHRRVQRANRGQHALEAGLAVGVDVQLVTAQLEVCPDPLHAPGDHVLEPHQRAVRLAIVALHQFVPGGAPSAPQQRQLAPRIAAVAGVARHRHNRQRPQRIQRLRGAESRLGLLEVTEPLAGTAPQVLHHVRSFWG